MEHFYSTYFLDLDSFFSIHLTEAYTFFQYYFSAVFNNCPLFYQVIYGYAPLTYLYIRRKFRKNNYKNYFDKSIFNWFFFNIKLLFFRLTKLIILFNFIEIFFKKIFYLLRHKYSSEYHYNFIFLTNFFKKITTRFVWRPTFKKYSYFGIFSLIRSKWFK